jgi:hypothetical protein
MSDSPRAGGATNARDNVVRGETFGFVDYQCADHRSSIDPEVRVVI